MQFSGVAFAGGLMRMLTFIRTTRPRKSRVFTRRDGTAGDVWSAAGQAPQEYDPIKRGILAERSQIH